MNRSKIFVMGVPYDKNSSFLSGAALAPPFIQKAFFSASGNLWAEYAIDLEGLTEWSFLDHISNLDSRDAFAEIVNSAEKLLQKRYPLITLGGDHSITYPLIQAHANRYSNLTILQFDAHPDLYDHLDGNRLSHASPFARIMENDLAQRLVQIGIRTVNGHQKKQAQRFGVEMHEMKDLSGLKSLSIEGPVYLSFDMDCLDPAYAPGIAHCEPGGMSTREVLSIIQNLDMDLIGADIVEFNPNRDSQGITAMVAAKILKEIVAKAL